MAENTIDKHLSDLLRTTEALLEASQEPQKAAHLLDRRTEQLRALERDIPGARLTAAQLSALERLIEAGNQLRQSMALERETLRERLRELRTVRRVQTALKPFRERKGHRLNVKL